MSNKPKPKPSVPTPRLQPIRATKPFQLRQGSPARKSPSSSPTPMLPRPGSDPRRNKWSSDHRNSPDRAERKSPSSPGIKVTNRRSPSPRVCRSSSHDPVGSYLTGQWPRDITSSTFFPLSNSGTSNKSTQTPVDWNSETLSSQTKNSKSLSRPAVAYQDHVEFKQMRQQMRRLAKSSRQEKKSPVHANHSALPQSQATQQRSISNPMPIYGRLTRRQNSWEGLNKEIENYTIIDSNDSIKFTGHGITPPDGHRAPQPRSATRSMETQTPQPQGFARDNTPANAESYTPSPSHDQSLHIGKMGEPGHSPYPKYASSPRPNNSYMFKREPPEGAESVKPFKEQDTQNVIGPSCPDKQKINFQISQNGSFKKWKRQQNVNGDILIPLIPPMSIISDGDGSCKRVAASIAGSYLDDV